ncbi:MAG: His/Gly/Thr/Pro-type tRNA ligase C-terminal domain-containing protein [Candidatus Hodarchaeales archaeon]
MDTIFDALSAQGAQINTSTQVYIIPIKTIDEAIELAGVLRKNRYYTEVDLLDRRLSKNLEYANRRNIPYVIIMGKRDLINDNVTLKSMVDGKEEKISMQRIVSRLHELINP